MSYVVIRRFRDGEGPSTTRSFRDQEPARTAAHTWAKEGWEVEVIVTDRLPHRSVHVPVPTREAFPDHN
ncbi:MAG: hypothetical protein ABR598_02125 [Candidatus Dormibacteria bacterium]